MIDLLSELTPNSQCKYVRSDEICKFVRIDVPEQRLYTKTPKDEDFTFASSYLTSLAESIEENVPFSVSQLLNNKGSNRAVIDSIMAHTSEIYWLKKDRSKYTVWVPSHPHKPGELCEWTDLKSLSLLQKQSKGNSALLSSSMSEYPHQQIFYGAPGTGKSHTIKRVVDDQGKICFRTTFHPDSDYSTFVGAYKPSMDKNKGKTVKAILDYDGMVDKFKEYIEATKNNITQASVLFGYDYHDSIVNMLDCTSHKIPDLVTEAYKSGTTYDTNVRAGMRVYEDHPQTRNKQIIYKFVPQAFTKAYVAAWKTEEEVYLVIEEINRGNCAQIFGDLFQLLDRKNGVSEYPIDADADLADYIEEKLEDSPRSDIPTDVRSGEKLMLPSNFYIWATMNTSDQSLFPIDSAFKRRWDWVYIPIKPHDEENYRIEIGTSTYNWWGFLEKINQVIDDTTSSEDKKLGYFFVKAEDKVVKADKFVSKVLFYLWNDVFKNYGFDNPIFSKGENKKFTFSDFFQKDGCPNEEMVNEFLEKLDEIIEKENSFKVFQNDIDSPSSLMVTYKGQAIEGKSARQKYINLITHVINDKGGDIVANCIGSGLTLTPDFESTRRYVKIDGTKWYLATQVGIDVIKTNLNKIKDSLEVDIVIETEKDK